MRSPPYRTLSSSLSDLNTCSITGQTLSSFEARVEVLIAHPPSCLFLQTSRCSTSGITCSCKRYATSSPCMPASILIGVCRARPFTGHGIHTSPTPQPCTNNTHRFHLCCTSRYRSNQHQHFVHRVRWRQSPHRCDPTPGSRTQTTRGSKR
jgi:hypothetical protein